MNSNPKECGQGDRLAIRARFTLAGDGSETIFRTVFCKHRGESLPLDTCLLCEDCTGVCFDPTGRRSFLTCLRGDDLGIAGERAMPLEQAPTESQIHPDTCRVPISTLMSRNVLCVTPDMSVEALTAELLEHDISGAPVVDRSGKPIGVVSKTDLLRMAHESDGTSELLPSRIRTQAGQEDRLGPGFHYAQLARATVEDIMTPVVFALSEDAPVTRAAAIMAYEGIHRIPVLSTQGEVVGLLSVLDIVRWVAEADGYRVPRPRPVRAG